MKTHTIRSLAISFVVAAFGIEGCKSIATVARQKQHAAAEEALTTSLNTRKIDDIAHIQDNLGRPLSAEESLKLLDIYIDGGVSFRGLASRVAEDIRERFGTPVLEAHITSRLYKRTPQVLEAYVIPGILESIRVLSRTTQKHWIENFFNYCLGLQQLHCAEQFVDAMKQPEQSLNGAILVRACFENKRPGRGVELSQKLGLPDPWDQAERFIRENPTDVREVIGLLPVISPVRRTYEARRLLAKPPAHISGSDYDDLYQYIPHGEADLHRRKRLNDYVLDGLYEEAYAMAKQLGYKGLSPEQLRQIIAVAIKNGGYAEEAARELYLRPLAQASK